MPTCLKAIFSDFQFDFFLKILGGFQKHEKRHP